MNTNKQITAMVVILFISLIAVGAYSIWDTDRSESASSQQFQRTVERGANTFALNCRVCHGDQGQGGSQDGRLPAAPALDSARLQGKEDLSYDDAFAFVTNTITCGRVGTQMPTWGEAFGGTLNQEQIHQLATLIVQGTWELAQEHSQEIDATTTGGATLQNPGGGLSADATEMTVNNASKFTPNQRIRIRLPEPGVPAGPTPENAVEEQRGANAEERMLILPEQIEVVRGVNGTAPATHETGTQLILADPDPGEDAETGLTLSANVDAVVTSLPISDLVGVDEGDIIILEDEQVRVTDIVTGVPTTLQQLVEEMGKTPGSFLASGASGLDEDMMIRIDGELMQITGIDDQGDAGIGLVEDLSASAGEMSVSDPAFFRPNYVVRIGEELVRIKDAVSTNQTLGNTIGRAQSSFSVSGTDGLSEGMIIRLDSELMRIVSLENAVLTLERGAEDSDGNATQPAAHAEGDRLLELPPPDAEEPPPAEDLETGAVLIEGVGADDTAVVVAGTQGIAPGSVFQLGDELVTVTDIQPVIATVERAVEGTETAAHSRRADIFDGSLLSVQRGFSGTDATSHSSGDTMNFTEVSVDRAIDGSDLEDHSKGAEIFLGNTLIVERGIENTDAVEHKNGVTVLDYPRAPDNPPYQIETCGSLPGKAPPEPTVTPGGAPTPTPGGGGPTINVSLSEYEVNADPASSVGGAITFSITNDGTIAHNFRLIASDLAPESLPQSGGQVDESAVDVVASIPDFSPGSVESATQDLPAGSYVLICNVPGHYSLGMHFGFDVTGP